MIFKVKKGQVALWIIIAIALFSIIMLLFLISKKPLPVITNEINFQSRIIQCIQEKVEESSDKMISQGGFLNPQNYRKYNEVNVVYLCENIGYYKPCINQHPVYITEIKEEIYDNILPVTKDCFDFAIKDLETKNFNVSEGEINLSVELASDLIILEINKEITLGKNENVQKFQNFEIRLKSPLYDLAKVANEIANQEAKYCYFEYLGYSILYPRFSIRRFVFSDSTEIYSIKDLESKKEMNIAIRGCAIPPGI